MRPRSRRSWRTRGLTEKRQNRRTEQASNREWASGPLSRWRTYVADADERRTGFRDRGVAGGRTPVRFGAAFRRRGRARRDPRRAFFPERLHGRRGGALGAAEVSGRGQAQVPADRAARFVG